MTLDLRQGDCLSVLSGIPDGLVQCCVTSPPYWGLRDYGTAKWDGGDINCDHTAAKRKTRYDYSLASSPIQDGTRSGTDAVVGSWASSCPTCGARRIDAQLGLEKTPDEYVGKMVQVFREVRRVLKDDGTLWLNLGDSYAGGGRGGGAENCLQRTNVGSLDAAPNVRVNGLKPKDLIGVPWRVAFAMQADGWWLRSDIIWHKPNPMPESVTDRPTKAHEYIFLLSKAERYYYNAEAIKEPPSPDLIKQIEEGYNGHATKSFADSLAQDASATKSRIINGYRQRIDKQRGHSRPHVGFNDRWDGLTKEEQAICGRNKRSVWTIATVPYPDAHFATYPPDLIKPCILAGSRPGDVVLDPFAGSGTTGQVAIELGRKALLIELNPKDRRLIEERCNVTPGLAI